jgi:integrase
MRERPSKAHKTGRYELRAYAGRDQGGKPRQVSRIFVGGKRDARKALDKLVAEVDAGRHLGSDITFGKVLDEWLEKCDDLGLARATMDSRRNHVKHHIRPALGAVRLDKIDRTMLDHYFRDLRTGGMAPGTVRLDHSIVSAALGFAIDRKWIASNPARGMRLRKPDTPDSHLTADDLRALYFGIEKDGKHLPGALEDDPDVAVVLALGALTGARRGELCGMRWSDVDWDRQCIGIERAWVPTKGGQHLTTTKTGKARTAWIGPAGVELLAGYQDSKRALLGQDPDGWLLSYDGGTTPMRAKGLTDYVARLGRRVGVKVHFHQLRHFAASELAALGVDLPTAAAQLGHSPGTMASTYLHATDERGAKAGALISGAVMGALTQGPAPSSAGGASEATVERI